MCKMSYFNQNVRTYRTVPYISYRHSNYNILLRTKHMQDSSVCHWKRLIRKLIISTSQIGEIQKLLDESMKFRESLSNNEKLPTYNTNVAFHAYDVLWSSSLLRRLHLATILSYYTYFYIISQVRNAIWDWAFNGNKRE